jgi:beta-phosphoglucomutase
MKYKGIIFDFNGVLLWDSHLHEKAWGDFSKILRGNPLSSEEIFGHVHGRTNKYVLEYVLNRTITPQELHVLSSQKESLYQELCLQNQEEFQLSPGAIDLLNFLVNNDIPHTIATASDGNNLKFFIKHLKLDKWFITSEIVHDDGSFSGKLDMFLKAAENLKLPPEYCIVIEDSKSGIRAAHEANIGKIIGFGPKDKHDLLLSLDGVSEAICSLDQFDKTLVSLK